ncbi:hypothetical protein [Roseateles amylovorans]|uniref:Uncharacterized protein n=1 Tax=Roseateles amylovorans TaxID=2978473 RepID=A0ABY6B102_9BURK|nr:hypothetical protein [Roseateles amylovorans]UXH78525.1 hypothetical protein N4261_00885 [Roseateles amylovorans]
MTARILSVLVWARACQAYATFNGVAVTRALPWQAGEGFGAPAAIHEYVRAGANQLALTVVSWGPGGHATGWPAGARAVAWLLLTEVGHPVDPQRSQLIARCDWPADDTASAAATTNAHAGSDGTDGTGSGGWIDAIARLAAGLHPALQASNLASFASSSKASSPALLQEAILARFRSSTVVTDIPLHLDFPRWRWIDAVPGGGAADEIGAGAAWSRFRALWPWRKHPGAGATGDAAASAALAPAGEDQSSGATPTPTPTPTPTLPPGPRPTDDQRRGPQRDSPGTRAGGLRAARSTGVSTVTLAHRLLATLADELQRGQLDGLHRALQARDEELAWAYPGPPASDPAQWARAMAGTNAWRVPAEADLRLLPWAGGRLLECVDAAGRCALVGRDAHGRPRQLPLRLGWWSGELQVLR